MNELTLALVAAARAGQIEIGDLLLDAGAQISLPDGSRWTTLHSAVAGNSLEMVQHLLRR